METESGVDETIYAPQIIEYRFLEKQQRLNPNLINLTCNEEDLIIAHADSPELEPCVWVQSDLNSRNFSYEQARSLVEADLLNPNLYNYEPDRLFFYSPDNACLLFRNSDHTQTFNNLPQNKRFEYLESLAMEYFLEKLNSDEGQEFLRIIENSDPLNTLASLSEDSIQSLPSFCLDVLGDTNDMIYSAYLSTDDYENQQHTSENKRFLLKHFYRKLFTNHPAAADFFRKTQSFILETNQNLEGFLTGLNQIKDLGNIINIVYFYIEISIYCTRTFNGLLQQENDSAFDFEENLKSLLMDPERVEIRTSETTTSCEDNPPLVISPELMLNLILYLNCYSVLPKRWTPELADTFLEFDLTFPDSEFHRSMIGEWTVEIVFFRIGDILAFQLVENQEIELVPNPLFPQLAELITEEDFRSSMLRYMSILSYEPNHPINNNSIPRRAFNDSFGSPLEQQGINLNTSSIPSYQDRLREEHPELSYREARAIINALFLFQQAYVTEDIADYLMRENRIDREIWNSRINSMIEFGRQVQPEN